MDYKTTILKRELKTDEQLLPEFNGLHFGIMGEDRAVFDYTAYFEENGTQPFDHKWFMRANKRLIESLIDTSGRKTAELFYQNTNGHILVAAELVFLFLAFAEPELCRYFNGLLTDAITDGIALSNGFIYSQAAQKLPSDILSDIIKARQNDGSEAE